MPHTSPRPDVPLRSTSRDPRTTGPLPAAVLWDMDGTLVDTEPAWMGAEIALVEEFGGTWAPADAVQMIGLPLLDSAAILRDHGVPLDVEEIASRLVQGVARAISESLVWQPGARELLTALRDSGVPCALVTMSYRVLAEAVVARAPGGVFDVLVTGDEVTHGKPDPEPYLRAADLLGVDVTECVAVEDSRPGIASALASGARTLGVQHIVPVDAQPGLSRTDSLARIGLRDLAVLRSGGQIDHLDGQPG
ncbi:HAD family hydrolase [Cellulomonas bogoriensis]|uniref:Hydrolase n=1 Tax=Cellulomonas bogoriensis 69B4 = DSM 16987 TaxID=1386082 RepID=A0A0A0C2G7_9CELL|nr:HAD family phosphatase [Cellulomonas bogoriensis]KGM14365.1 hydrolase [Cellulomonas bogoriensis 69B4 = DSM 16987]